MTINEYVADRSQEGGKTKTDIEQLRQTLNEQQSQIDDLADTLDTLMTEVIPNG